MQKSKNLKCYWLLRPGCFASRSGYQNDWMQIEWRFDITWYWVISVKTLKGTKYWYPALVMSIMFYEASTICVMLGVFDHDLKPPPPQNTGSFKSDSWSFQHIEFTYNISIIALTQPHQDCLTQTGSMDQPKLVVKGHNELMISAESPVYTMTLEAQDGLLCLD